MSLLLWGAAARAIALSRPAHRLLVASSHRSGLHTTAAVLERLPTAGGETIMRRIRHNYVPGRFAPLPVKERKRMAPPELIREIDAKKAECALVQDPVQRRALVREIRALITKAGLRNYSYRHPVTNEWVRPKKGRPVKDAFFFTQKISEAGDRGDYEGAFMWLDEMISNDTWAKPAVWNALIDVCAKAGWGERAISLYADMRRRRLPPDQSTFTSLFTALAKNSYAPKVEQAKKYRAQMSAVGVEPNAMVLNAYLMVFAKAGLMTEAIALMNEEVGIENFPNEATVTMLSVNCRTVEHRTALFDSVLARRRADTNIWNALLKGAMAAPFEAEAREDPKMSWERKSERIIEMQRAALTVLTEMVEAQVEPNIWTFLILVGEQRRSFSVGGLDPTLVAKAFAESGLTANLPLVNALMLSLGRRRRFDEAFALFECLARGASGKKAEKVEVQQYDGVIEAPPMGLGKAEDVGSSPAPELRSRSKVRVSDIRGIESLAADDFTVRAALTVAASAGRVDVAERAFRIGQRKGMRLSVAILGNLMRAACGAKNAAAAERVLELCRKARISVDLKMLEQLRAATFASSTFAAAINEPLRNVVGVDVATLQAADVGQQGRRGKFRTGGAAKKREESADGSQSDREDGDGEVAGGASDGRLSERSFAGEWEDRRSWGTLEARDFGGDRGHGSRRNERRFDERASGFDGGEAPGSDERATDRERRFEGAAERPVGDDGNRRSQRKGDHFRGSRGQRPFAERRFAERSTDDGGAGRMRWREARPLGDEWKKLSVEQLPFAPRARTDGRYGGDAPVHRDRREGARGREGTPRMGERWAGPAMHRATDAQRPRSQGGYTGASETDAHGVGRYADGGLAFGDNLEAPSEPNTASKSS